MKLIAKLIAGILAGVIFGFLAPEWFLRTLLTVKVLIGEMINFTIPLIILFFITSGIASLPQNSGKLLGKTVGLAYASTIVAGTVAFLIASQVIPLLTPVTESVAHNAVKLEPFMQMSIPPLFGVMTALATAFLFGIGISKTQNVTLKSASDGGRDIIDGLLAKVIIPLLPLYIAGVFAEMTLDGTVFSTLKTFGIVLVLAISMHWLWLTVLYVAAGLVSGRSPLFLLRTMLPAYFTAVGTMSSAATIPVTLRQSKAMGVSEGVANFTVPLCATIHLSGSTITLVTCATAVMYLAQHMAIPSLLTMLPFILMLGVTMIAAPGAPGGAVMSALGLLGSMLGFTEAQLALMIALYLAQDSFGTACNVTGDGAISLLVDNGLPHENPNQAKATQA